MRGGLSIEALKHRRVTISRKFRPRILFTGYDFGLEPRVPFGALTGRCLSSNGKFLSSFHAGLMLTLSADDESSLVSTKVPMGGIGVQDCKFPGLHGAPLGLFAGRGEILRQG